MPGVEAGPEANVDVSDEKELCVWLRDLFPEEAGIGIRAIKEILGENRIRREWRESIRGFAPVRQREFLAGRLAAEDSLAAWLPRGTYSIGIGEGREPVWPDGFCGSLSHTREWAVAAGGRREALGSVGVDLEDPTRLSPKTWRMVLTPAEQDWIHLHIPERDWNWWGTLIFSLKECFYKWQYPLTGAWLGFQEASVELEVTTMCGSARLHTIGEEGAYPLARRRYTLGYCGDSRMVLTGMWGHPDG